MSPMLVISGVVGGGVEQEHPGAVERSARAARALWYVPPELMVVDGPGRRTFPALLATVPTRERSSVPARTLTLPNAGPKGSVV